MTPIRTPQRYRCEYCRRTGIKSHIARHEAICFWNPSRVCGCENGTFSISWDEDCPGCEKYKKFLRDTLGLEYIADFQSLAIESRRAALDAVRSNTQFRCPTCRAVATHKHEWLFEDEPYLCPKGHRSTGEDATRMFIEVLKCSETADESVDDEPCFPVWTAPGKLFDGVETFA